VHLLILIKTGFTRPARPRLAGGLIFLAVKGAVL